MKTKSRAQSGVDEKRHQASFPGYTGRILWDVTHPDYPKPVRVLAPHVGSKNGAACIVAAASYWGRRWQDIDFYAHCDYKRVDDKMEVL